MEISYASIVKQASPPPLNNTYNFTAEQIVSLVTNVVIQITQPHLCTRTLPEKQVQAKSDLSKQIAETAKKCLGANIAAKDVFESIISRPAPPPPAPFVFSSTLVEKKKAPLLKASTILNKAAPPSVTPSSNSTKSTKPLVSSKLSPQQNKTSSTKPSPNKPTTYSACQAILDLIKEKRRLRRLHNNAQDPNIKSTVNRLQKEFRTKINQESTISWEKFCNSISLESDPKKSWRKITNFLKPKGPRSYPTLKLGNKTAKTNPEKAQLFAESVERNFGIESHLFSKSQFDRINKFLEAHSYHFTPLDSIHGNITDTDDSDLVADVDPNTLIRIVRTELKKW